MENKYQSQPTHFIEVFIDEDGNCINEEIEPIEKIAGCLETTVLFGFKTLAIFKITPRTKN